MPQDLVTIRILDDQVVAEMYRDILEQEGIVTMIPGAFHRGMLGMMGGYIEIPLKVAAQDAERATEIIEAIEADVEQGSDENRTTVEDDERSIEEPQESLGVGEKSDRGEREGRAQRTRDASDDQDTDEGGDEDTGTTGRRTRPKLKRIAFFIAFAIPGGGHFYVGWWLLGLLFLVAEVAAGVLLTVSGELMLALVWYPGMVLADALGAVSRVREVNGGPPARGLRVWGARGAPLLPVVAALGLVFVSARAPAWYAGPGGVTLCAAMESCASEAPGDCVTRLSRGLRRMELDRKTLGLCGRCMGAHTCETMRQECENACFDIWQFLDAPPAPRGMRPALPILPISLDQDPTALPPQDR